MRLLESGTPPAHCVIFSFMLSCLLRKLLPVCLLLMLCGLAVQAAPVPEGTLISNTATATFVDSASGLSARLNSNTVNTRVSVLEALTLTASQNVLIATGGPFAISHTLTNTGNAPTSYALSTAFASGSGFTPINLQVVHDINGNGRADAGEPAIASGGSLSLAAGASANFLLSGQSPAAAVPGQSAQIVLRAVSQLQGAMASNTDTVNLTNCAAVQVTLAASSGVATPGAVLGLTATAVNNGSVAASPAAVTVNGAPVSLVVLRVPVPANGSFAAAQASTNLGAQTLYHVLGAPTNSYVATVPAGAVVDAVAWAIASLPQGGSLQGQFSVQVNTNAAGVIAATAYVDWRDQAALLSTVSNTVVLPLPVYPASISFYTGTGYTLPSVQSTSGNPLFVQVNAAACNADPALIATVPVTLISQLTGDVETFTAIETGPNTGLFRILPNVPTANGAVTVVASGNGVLEVLRDDLITASITACGGVSVSATTTLLIDPSGVVYDSRTNFPVAGASVQLIDVTGAGNGGNAGGPAAVLQP
ncbi:MAG: hypothetical protein MUP33_12775, partial [Polaromonas sp.]|nr:hypothetical protein [Polaromonas sp.]